MEHYEYQKLLFRTVVFQKKKKKPLFYTHTRTHKNTTRDDHVCVCVVACVAAAVERTVHIKRLPHIHYWTIMGQPTELNPTDVLRYNNLGIALVQFNPFSLFFY